ncbi:hypothetical protein L6452_33003 [Arctium lappa]|uniref:Uncharacterized protein n=1 Tax=Arctium lappa TaxID=4217 RepID=A0ACB8Z598_ARCLA|nr:hypothetical protein L6452_33003 [Arctium lappa]
MHDENRRNRRRRNKKATALHCVFNNKIYMGVPSFYKWMVDKYPKIVVNAVEKAEEDYGTLPNPNGHEFDNLYLDMNGIIHPCFHPEEDDGVQLNYEEVFENIFEYIDRILKIVRPRKLLFMAIDGVAPRAKMNQQRTRRFRNAKDREILRKEEDRLRRQYELEGRDLLPIEESEVSDSNVITPGTAFMAQLSKQLQTYIRLRISNHHAWERLKVILSDSNVLGEGEHKIMSFIRLQRTCPGYNPNTSHVLYGLDADLIMLALASHEVHFSILRENVLVEGNTTTSNSTGLFLAGKSEANVAKCRGWFKQFDLNQGLKDSVERMSSLDISSEVSNRKSLKKKPYQFLHVWILREYLNLDLKMANLPEKFEPDIERLIDDFIFISLFAGNDFLPHMPTLEIHEGAIDLLIHVYKEEFKNLGGYLVDVQKVDDKKGGYIKLKRVEKFILAVGAYEDKIFTKRSKIRESALRCMLSENKDARCNEEEDLSPDGDSSCSVRSPDHNIVANTKKLKEQLKSYAREISNVSRNGLVTDVVKLSDHGWKDRYYKYKFSAETEEDMEKTRKILVAKYTEGLCWVLLYYFSGVPSWTWFFPYHYGPFASDLKGLSSTRTMFRKGMPFKPFDQLMAVLPPMSAHALPVSYQSLMTDEDSSIRDFYPTEFDMDMDGKRYLWQGICKLPFIEEERLLAATKKIEKELSEEEAKRNAENVDQLFMHKLETLALRIINAAGSMKQNISIKIDTELSGDINGFVHFKQESENVSDSNGLANDRDVLCVYYQPPCFSLHIPRVLEGTTIPETVVHESDIDQERQLWHDKRGYQGQNNRSYNHVQAGAKTNPNVGSKTSSCPGVIIRGGGSGWSSIGRGNYNATRPLKGQTSCPMYSDAYGRGARRNNSSNQPSRWTDHLHINSGFEQKGQTSCPTYSDAYGRGAHRNNNSNQPSRWTDHSHINSGFEQKGQTSCPTYSDAYGRGAHRNNNSNQPSRWTDHSRINSGFEQKGQTSCPTYSDAYGRGAHRNNNSNQPSTWTDHSRINSGFEQKGRALTTQSTKYPARTVTNKANDQFWPVRLGSGSGSKQAVQRWGDAQSKDNDRW